MKTKLEILNEKLEKLNRSWSKYCLHEGRKSNRRAMDKLEVRIEDICNEIHELETK